MSRHTVFRKKTPCERKTKHVSLTSIDNSRSLYKTEYILLTLKEQVKLLIIESPKEGARAQVDRLEFLYQWGRRRLICYEYAPGCGVQPYCKYIQTIGHGYKHEPFDRGRTYKLQLCTSVWPFFSIYMIV